MRSSSGLLLVAATAILLTSAADTGQAARKVTLNQCIANYESCREHCWRDAPLPPPFGWMYCNNKCEDTRRACVDEAMTPSPGNGGPSKRRPKRPAGERIPPPGILELPPIFPRQPPAPTGRPSGSPSGSLR